MALLLYQLVVLSFVLALLVLLVVNLIVLPRLDPTTGSAPEAAPLVSILVPARNEAANIERCVRSLLAQSYPRFELLVLDDQSTDGTGAILARLAADPRLKVLTGTPLLPGWLGKANACRQLAAAAQGEYLLFTDADTEHRPAALAAAMQAWREFRRDGPNPNPFPTGEGAKPEALAIGGQADSPSPAGKGLGVRAGSLGLLSMFPRQITGTPSERLIIPLMHFAVYALLPLPAAFRLRSPAFAAANGQFMLFSRAAYDACGGHGAVKGEVLEDVALSRRVKLVGYVALLVDGGDLVSTRMYRGLAELWAGFSKNLFAFFGNSLPFLALGMGAYALLFVMPVLWLVAALLRVAFGWLPDRVELWAWVLLPLMQYGAAVVARLLLARRFAFAVGPTFLHPLAIAVQIVIALNSARLARRGGATWKGRPVTKSE